MGIEPTSEAWEASILPLYDARSLQLPRLYLITRPHEKPAVRLPVTVSPSWPINPMCHLQAAPIIRSTH
jgi:hypothetical protein